MSGHMSGQERKLDAAEYVIGTLSAAERGAFEALIETDKDTRKDVAFWERAFGALNASVSPEAPPAAMWERIEAALPQVEGADVKTAVSAASLAGASAALPANDNMSANLRKSRGRWRLGAIAAGIAALGLGAVLMNPQLDPRAPAIGPIAGNGTAQEYIAVVNANGDQPSLVINIDAKTGAVTVRSVGVERPDGKSLELWYVPEGQKAVSVGLVGEGGIDLKDIKAKNGDLLAISLEPNGGSPTGTATGPVIYTGKLIKNVTE